MVGALKAEVERRWGTLELLDVLKEADFRTGFTDEVSSVAAREVTSRRRFGSTGPITCRGSVLQEERHEMLKRNFAVVLASALVLGGGTMAWATSGSGSTDPAKEMPHERVDPARSAAVKQCISDSGVDKGREPTDAERQAVKACLAPLGLPKGDFDGPGDGTVDPVKSAAVRNCFSNTGVVKGEAPTDAQRQALKACVAAAGNTTGEPSHSAGDHRRFPSESQ